MIKILLICNAGMSTSMLVNKMKKYAQENDIDAHIKAISSVNIKDELESGHVDVILLGPQVKYLKKQMEVDFIALNIPIEPISMIDYGAMNGEKVLRFAIEVAERHNP